MHVIPSIEKSKAEELMSKNVGLLAARKTVLKSELVYLPLYLFNLVLEDNRKNQFHEMITVDGLKGEFAFFRESAFEKSTTWAAERCECRISGERAREIASGEYTRLLLKNNLRKGNNVRIISFGEETIIYYPYWIGYFKRQNRYDFEVIDAVTGDKQGIKMKPVFIDLLLQTSDVTRQL